MVIARALFSHCLCDCALVPTSHLCPRVNRSQDAEICGEYMEGFDPALVASIIASTRRAKSLCLRQGTAHRGQSCPWPWELIACICHSPHRSQAAGVQGCPLITWRMSAMDQHYCSCSTPQRQHEPLEHGGRSISAQSQSSRPRSTSD